MAYSLLLAVGFGSTKTGLVTVGYQLKNANGTNNGIRVTTGIVEIGSGYYQAAVSIPDGHIGGILWDTGEALPKYAYLEINTSPVNFIVNPVNVSVPAQPNTCRIFIWARNPDGTLMTTLTGNVRITALPYKYSGAAHKGDEISFIKHADGYWYVDVVYGATITIYIPVLGINISALVPSQPTKDISEFIP